MNHKKLLLKQPELRLPPVDVKQDQDFAVKYANHVATNPTGWDLRLTFSCIDTASTPNALLQHTAISLPWPTVKCLTYLLRLQLIAYETLNGHVPMPTGGLNPPLESVPAEFKHLPKAKTVQESVLKLWDEFVKENPEVVQSEKQGK
jgi:hypothetical protein